MPKKAGKKKEIQMDPVMEKAITAKIEKKQVLTKEEEVEVLKDQDPFPGNKTVIPDEPAAEEQAPEPEKKVEPKSEKAPEPDKEDLKIDTLKLEEQLAKPEGQEDLTGFSKREAAYFWQMRRDRRARQKAEEDADAARFELSVMRRTKEAQPEKAPEDPLEALKKKDPTDFLTVAEVTKIVEGLKQPAKKEDQAQEAKIPPLLIKHLQFCETEARAAHPEDFDAVMELTNEIINTNKDYLLQVRDALNGGENPAEVSYRLIKSDPEFAKLYPAAEIRAKARAKKSEKTPDKNPEKVDEEAKAREKALEDNKEKPKTTGHLGGSHEKSSEQYSMEEISRMSDKQFRQLPRNVRQKYLEMYG